MFPDIILKTMVLISKTGLLSSVQKTVPRRPPDSKTLDFKNIAVPAPFVLRPFAGIYNPFPYGCSILCNHPADCEAKDVVKRAKESWAVDGKAILNEGARATDDTDDLVPEELFCHYTETDSRPITHMSSSKCPLLQAVDGKAILNEGARATDDTDDLVPEELFCRYPETDSRPITHMSSSKCPLLQAVDGKAILNEGARATDDTDDLVPEELFRRYTETDSRPINHMSFSKCPLLQAVDGEAILNEGARATDDTDDLVPEELFRRYTETDSRPINHMSSSKCPLLQAVDGKAILNEGARATNDTDDLVPEELFRRYTETDSRPINHMSSSKCPLLQAVDGKAILNEGARATDDTDDLVPEELFRRYTETDSRPITPTPTLASVMTRVPRGRRCVTPDPVPRPSQERTLLVLDLRRSHSQETLSCHASGLPTTVLQPPTRSPTPSSGTGMTTTRKPNKPRNRLSPDHLTRPEDSLAKPAMMSLPPPTVGEDESLPRRRGRLRRKGKKSGRDLSAGIEKEVKGFPEPGETQVSAFGIDSRLASARASLTMQGGEGGSVTTLEGDGWLPHTPEPSYLDLDILKQLRRELDQEVIDSEFDHKRRIALQEALRTFPMDNKLQHNEEMIKLQKELRLPPENTELWLSLPRTFSRQSARFELPLDRRQLNTMTPLEYVQRHISITSHRRLLYNRVFNRHKKEVDAEDVEQDNTNRTISGKKMKEALGEMMGRPFTEEEYVWFQDIVGWKDEDWMDFRTWCGICALCERILGPKFCSQLPSREADPPNGVEQADFDSLSRRLEALNPDPRLKTILISIKTL